MRGENISNCLLKVGFKPAGGIKTVEEGLSYVALVKNVRILKMKTFLTKIKMWYE